MPDYTFDAAVQKLMKSKKWRAKVCADPVKEITNFGDFTEGQRAAIMDLACRFFITTLDKALEGTGETHDMWITDD